ncbi:dehydrodolichyl diphosphate synthase complex subunit Dhdds-like isoform X3 [Branchiostoma floridae]|uniref:Alkyl transferase n=1 Tax=Branchiostoma floridae TaxID=7739 RepID=A0A9J7L584_BRAFL|nr:dehydrodolichyl diphosphate synthase complex subunit Dhdds-like isoform X1 [Branchiostoma floridae]XP_035676289.1 dehydrodolichyl diphosphate synthase complex subunit Dhdds-like isoform X2 [Branchiostoma floridae]XP_035676291.1 dehydrodolichyl diphosphate synthase complex subunit Dhdds-like isoform X3 [Branchiostoma floridae]
MSWIREETPPDENTWSERFRKFCANVLKTGPIPKHVAFIMDGNRRFARKKGMDRAEGHLMGFEKLAETLKWCRDLGINEVTVYAFSIENFKRSKEEVESLMEIARQKFTRLLQEKDAIMKHGVCIRVLGNLTLLPLDIQRSIAEAMVMSKDNDKAFLNVCFAYTSRHEISNAVEEMAEGVEKGLIRPSDVSESLLDRCLYTSHSPDPHLLVRTSGEVRLSDFLLWQSSFSVLSFMEVLWPEFSFWHLCAAVLHYQRNHQAIMRARDQHNHEREQALRQADYDSVVAELQQEDPDKTDQLKWASVPSLVRKQETERDRRVQEFLQHLDRKRAKFLDNLVQKSEIKVCS